MRLQAEFDLKPLRPKKVSMTIAPGLVPDCNACQSPCCLGLENVVSLRLSDIGKLIDIDKTELISVKKPRFPKSMLEERPHLEELMSSTLFRALPVLQQVGPEAKCAAWQDNRNCGLYPNWPLSCERFPYTLSPSRLMVWGTRCPSSQKNPLFKKRTQEMREATVRAYNERIHDAILIQHARPELSELGIAKFLTRPNEDPFVDASEWLQAPGLQRCISDRMS